MKALTFKRYGKSPDIGFSNIDRPTLQPDELDYVPQVALIAIVGEGMSHAIGIAAKVFGALAEARVNVRLINQGPSELNIMVGVAPEDYPTALRAIYAAFVTGAQ